MCLFYLYTYYIFCRVISVFPRGKGSARNNYFSLYLKLVDTERLPLGRKVYAEFKMAAWNDSDEQKKKQGYTYKEGKALRSHDLIEYIIFSLILDMGNLFC